MTHTHTHSESDLGVPLAPSAMDPKSYQGPKDVDNVENTPKLHPDDQALLDWTGPMGDTAAIHLKQRQDQARAAARLALAEGKGRIPKVLLPQQTSALASATSPAATSAAVSGKKAFSRVLDETMQSWMKKTTYLSNDYSRKVHDFKSLAQTKQQVAQELEEQQQKLAERRTTTAISKSFKAVTMPPTHPTKKHLKPKRIMPILPNVDLWGHTFTHVVMDKVTNLDLTMCDINQAMVAEVEEHKKRMFCELWVPPPKGWKDPDEKKEEEKVDGKEKEGDNQKKDKEGDNKEEEKGDDDNKNKEKEEEKEEKDKKEEGEDGKPTKENKKSAKDMNTITYHPVQKFDLDVVTLVQDEDEPPAHFALLMDKEKDIVTYLPIRSRVQLSTARPIKRRTLHKVARREPTDEDLEEQNEKLALVDEDVAKKIGAEATTITKSTAASTDAVARRGSESFLATGGGGKTGNAANDGDDDDDSDSDGINDPMEVDKAGANDSDDDSDDEEETFGGATKTIVAD